MRQGKSDYWGRKTMRQFTTGILSALLVLLTSQLAQAHPAVFSKLSFEQAKLESQKQHKILLVDFTASWCGPCKYMDQTTWIDKNVVDWVSKNAIAIQVDVDEREDVARQMSVFSMPTVIALNPANSAEMDRHRGYMDAAKLLIWIEGVERGETAMETLKRKLAEVNGKGGPQEIQVRSEMARLLLETNKFYDAGTQFIWLWQNMEKEASGMSGVRTSFLAAEMKALAGIDPMSRHRFMVLRDSENRSLDDWIILNGIVGESKSTLDWFDKNKHDKQFLMHLPGNAQKSLEQLFIKTQRMNDLGILYPDPVSEIRSRYRTLGPVKPHLDGYDPFPQEAGTLYGALLYANRDAEASATADESVKLCNTAGMRFVLMQNWLGAMSYRFMHSSGLQSLTTMQQIWLGLGLLFSISAAIAFVRFKLRKAH